MIDWPKERILVMGRLYFYKEPGVRWLPGKPKKTLGGWRSVVEKHNSHTFHILKDFVMQGFLKEAGRDGSGRYVYEVNHGLVQRVAKESLIGAIIRDDFSVRYL